MLLLIKTQKVMVEINHVFAYPQVPNSPVARLLSDVDQVPIWVEDAQRWEHYPVVAISLSTLPLIPATAVLLSAVVTPGPCPTTTGLPAR